MWNKQLVVSILCLVLIEVRAFQSTSKARPPRCSFPINNAKSLFLDGNFPKQLCFDLKLCHRVPGKVSHRHQPSNIVRLQATSIATSVSVLPLSDAVAATRGIGSFFLTRIVFLRGLAFVYFIAFQIALRQNKGLIGDNGITPGKIL
jgi:hypothetical protein